MDESRGHAVRAAVLLTTRIGRLHDSLVQSSSAGHDLTSSDFRVLALLELYGPDRPASPTVLASWIVQTSGGLAATLRRLEDRGLIDRSDDPSDGRGKLVAITPQGRAVYHAVFDDLARSYDDLAADIDLDGLVDVLSTLLSAYEARTPRPPSARWDGQADLMRYATEPS